MGGCFATDKITVDGMKVGYMYREEPDEPMDSGWRFFSGIETQEYIDDLNNTMMYNVNTIGNYDEPTIPLPATILWSKFGKGRWHKHI